MAVIAVDLDGVVHRYGKGWADGSIYDLPVPGTREALGQLKAAGHRLVLHTTRVRDIDQIQPLYDWLDANGFQGLFAEITDRKPLAHVFIDDRAVRFRDWPQALADTAAALSSEGRG
jgi:hydroxymethylpyrimidine pyrophosphatase-like HAD family hydrolase